MKNYIKFVLAIAMTIIITSMVTAYFVKKNVWAAFVSMSYDMDASNGLYRVKSWDQLEQLLVKGCSKEALEYVKMEQSLGLSSLQWHLNNGSKLDKKVEEENVSIISRAKAFEGKGSYTVPTCK